MQLQNGHLFFSHAELGSFWEAAGNAASELSEEATSLLAASEEGLEALDVGFFGALPGPAENGLRPAPHQEEGTAASRAGAGGGRDDRGRWMQEAESKAHSKHVPPHLQQDDAEKGARREEAGEDLQGGPLPAASGDRQQQAQAGAHANAHAPAARRVRRTGRGFSDEPPPMPPLPPHLGGGAATPARTAAAAEGAAKVAAAAQPVPASAQRDPQQGERAQHGKRARDTPPKLLCQPQQPQQHAEAAGRAAAAGPAQALPLPLSAAHQSGEKTAPSSRQNGSVQKLGQATGVAQHEGSAARTGSRDSIRAPHNSQAGVANGS